MKLVLQHSAQTMVAEYGQRNMWSITYPKERMVPDHLKDIVSRYRRYMHF